MQDLKFRFGLIKISNEEPIPEEEPVFILRARDTLAISTLEHYAGMSNDDGCTNDHLRGMGCVIRAFKAFKSNYAERMKQPGCTRGR
jgi:hypothetical protein